MAKLDVVGDLIESVPPDGFYDIRPGVNEEWVIHNIYYGGAIHLERYDGTHSLVFASEVKRSHKENDTTNSVTSPNASDQGTLNTLLNEIKADYNAHRVSTTFHNAADSVNVVDAAAASNLATSLTLANQIKAGVNSHRSQETVHPHFDAINLISSPSATDLDSCKALANEEKGDYNGHLTATASGVKALFNFHVTNTTRLRVKNISGVTNLIAFDGVVTR